MHVATWGVLKFARISGLSPAAQAKPALAPDDEVVGVTCGIGEGDGDGVLAGVFAGAGEDEEDGRGLQRLSLARFLAIRAWPP